VVLTIILIGLTLVAVGIVWVVISNILEESIEEIDVSSLKFDLEIEKALIEEGNMTITIKRLSGAGDIENKILIVLSSDEASQEYTTEEGLKEVQTKTFSFPLEIIDIDKIEVYPVIIKNGEEKIKTAASDTFSFVDTSLVAYYPFDEDTKDKSGNGHNGEVYGDASLVTGKIGQAYDFDGSGDYILIPYSDDFDVSDENEITIAGWVYFNNIRTGGDIIGTQKGCWEQNSYRINEYTHSSYLRFSLGGEESETCSDSPEGYYKQDYINSPAIQKDKWHFFATTAGSEELCIYLDDQKLCNQRDFEKVPTIAKFNRDLIIGAVYDYAYYFNGTIDELRIYNRALSEFEIQSMYNQTK